MIAWTRETWSNDTRHFHMQVVDVISNTQQDNLEKLQQRAIRTITMNKPYLFNTNWPPLNLRRKMHTAIMTFKCLKNHVPYFLQNSITFYLSFFYLM